MKKNNLVLLTVLIMLVLYCGVVIFVTKPSDFAYEALFKDADSSVKAPATETPAVDRAELTAEMEAIASKYADKAVDQAGKNADAAIKEAIGNIDIDTGSGTVDIAAIVRTTVRDAVAEARTGIIQEAAALATSGILADRDDFISEVAQVVNDEYLLPGKDEVIGAVTDQVTENVTRSVTDSVAKTVTANVTKTVTDNVTKTVTDTVTKNVTEKITADVTDRVTASVTDGITNAVTKNVTENLLAYEDEVIDAVTENVTVRLLSREDEVVKAVTDSVLSREEELVDRVTQAVLDRIKTNLQEALQEVAEVSASQPSAAPVAVEPAGTTEPEPAPAVEEDYDALRKRMREEEIRKLLDQLQD